MRSAGMSIFLICTMYFSVDRSAQAGVSLSKQDDSILIVFSEIWHWLVTAQASVQTCLCFVENSPTQRRVNIGSNRSLSGFPSHRRGSGRKGEGVKGVMELMWVHGSCWRKMLHDAKVQETRCML